MSRTSEDLTGRIALVTGAAKRLGRHLALALGRAGADVIVHCHTSKSAAESVAAEIRAFGRRAWIVAADFTDVAAVRAMMRDVAAIDGRLDIIVNNVGNYTVKPIESASEEEWLTTLQVNLVAPFSVIKAAIDLFPPTGGHVVNIGYAGVEFLTANVNSTAYQVSKTGLLLLTRSFAQRLARRGVRVNMISPGHLENSVDLPADLKSAIPLGRPGRLEDIADAVLFLLKSDSYVTGINIDVAGGYRMSLTDKFQSL